MIKKLLKDPFIPIILLFSIILSLILVSEYSIITRSPKVLGASDPPNWNCEQNRCGFCKNCGGTSLNCGKTARCVIAAEEYKCQFDINCIR